MNDLLKELVANISKGMPLEPLIGICCKIVSNSISKYIHERKMFISLLTDSEQFSEEQAEHAFNLLCEYILENSEFTDEGTKVNVSMEPIIKLIADTVKV